MISQWELWACAQAMIGQHGEAAVANARRTAEDLTERGDLKGAATWTLIIHRIGELQHRRATVTQ